MRKLFSTALSILFIFMFLRTYLPAQEQSESSSYEAVLSYVIDGDTAVFIVNNQEQKVRFIGIDCPEDTTTKEEYGDVATAYTKKILEEANTIRLEVEPNATRQDKYERYLYWVYVDNVLLEELILLQGLAEVKYLNDNYQYTIELYDAENVAKQNKLNIWSNYE